MSWAIPSNPISTCSCSHSNGSCKLYTFIHRSRVSMVFDRRRRINIQRCFSSTSDSDGGAYGVSDANIGSLAEHRIKDQSKDKQAKPLTANELMRRLRRYGASGILSYGLLNTLYYLSAFLIVWCYLAPAPRRMGYAATVERFLKVMAIVWAGSQLTKLARVGLALALAPFVDKGLAWFTVKLKFRSQGRAFATIIGMCLVLALVFFSIVTLLWA